MLEMDFHGEISSLLISTMDIRYGLYWNSGIQDTYTGNNTLETPQPLY